MHLSDACGLLVAIVCMVKRSCPYVREVAMFVSESSVLYCCVCVREAVPFVTRAHFSDASRGKH